VGEGQRPKDRSSRENEGGRKTGGGGKGRWVRKTPLLVNVLNFSVVSSKLRHRGGKVPSTGSHGKRFVLLQA